MAQYNFGRQLVVDCWSSNRELASSELAKDARDGQQRSAGRAHRSGWRRDGQHVVEVWRRGRRQQDIMLLNCFDVYCDCRIWFYGHFGLLHFTITALSCGLSAFLSIVLITDI